MPTDAPAPDALRSALEKALPCYDDHEGPPVCRPTHSHDCPAHLRGKVYAAVAPLLASERAAREAAERDTERLDWMIANDAWIHAADRVKVRRTQETERVYQVEWSDGDGGWYETNIDAAPTEARKAIDDAARAAGKEGA